MFFLFFFPKIVLFDAEALRKLTKKGKLALTCNLKKKKKNRWRQREFELD